MTAPSVRWVPTANTDSIASARLRCYRPAAALARAGWDSALLSRYHPARPDVVVFQKAYGERHLALAARLRRRGTAVVFDLCDNHFVGRGGDPERTARADRLDRMIAISDMVTASTPWLSTLIEHPNVVVIDDAIDVVEPVSVQSSHPGRRLVWFGNAGSEEEGYGMMDLGAIADELRDLGRRMDFELVVLSNSLDAFERYIGHAGLKTRYAQWSPAVADKELRAADIALLPVTANPFTACKTANRVVTSLLYGLGTVAGCIPSYEEYSPYVRFGDWQKNIAAYLVDPSLRTAHVTAGQGYIADRFPADHLVHQWGSALRMALGQR